jgi:hypothetical protein
MLGSFHAEHPSQRGHGLDRPESPQLFRRAHPNLADRMLERECELACVGQFGDGPEASTAGRAAGIRRPKLPAAVGAPERHAAALRAGTGIDGSVARPAEPCRSAFATLAIVLASMAPPVLPCPGRTPAARHRAPKESSTALAVVGVNSITLPRPRVGPCMLQRVLGATPPHRQGLAGLRGRGLLCVVSRAPGADGRAPLRSGVAGEAAR